MNESERQSGYTARKPDASTLDPQVRAGMQVSYTLTLDEIDDGTRFVQRWTKLRRSALSRILDFCLFVVAIGVLAVYAFSIITDIKGSLFFLSMLGVGTAFGAVLFVILKGRKRTNWEKASQLGLMDRRLVLTRESLTLESKGAVTTLEWKFTREIQSTEEYIYIVLSGLLLVIPRRAFPSLDDSEAFLEFARSCLPHDTEPDHATYTLDIW